MDGIDVSATGNIILGLGAVGAVLWAAWERWIKNKAMQAGTEAQVAVSDAQHTVYSLVTARLESVEKELQSIRGELAVERAHSRKLELHIFKLESIMREANLQPPAFDG